MFYEKVYSLKVNEIFIIPGAKKHKFRLRLSDNLFDFIQFEKTDSVKGIPTYGHACTLRTHNVDKVRTNDEENVRTSIRCRTEE